MKVFRISRWMFAAISLLIIALPVSHHWRLLSGGTYTEGEVTGFVMQVRESAMGVKNAAYMSEIRFDADGRQYRAYGPANYEYREGRTVTVVYRRDDPSHNQVVTFSGFYLSNYAIIPMVLLTLWAAFYLSFNRYYKKPRSRGIRPR